MVKITVVESSGNEVRLRVEGRLTGRSAEELRNACDLQALSDGIPLTLDLADVSFADAAGIEVLRELKIRRVTLLSPSSLVAEQLKA
jgi:anti-anti-sigma regulatory factor